MRISRLVVAAVSSFGIAVATVGSTAIGGAAATAVATASPTIVVQPGAVHAGGASDAPPTTAYCVQHYKIACYEPAQIRRAYNLGPLLSTGIDGRGQTIVIVDSFGSPTVAHDLAVFDKALHLPAPPSLLAIQPAGKVPAYDPNNSGMVGWAGETTLDVEWAHTMAPHARILLVETPVSETEGTVGFPQIVTAEKYVINHHLGGVISQSFSATEETFPSQASLLALRGAYTDAARKGVTVLAAAGDSGAADVKFDQSTYYRYPVTSWPDSDPLVTGVGATQLHLNARGDRTAPDSVWNDTYTVATNQFIDGGNGPNPMASGGGKSVFFARPGYQNPVRDIVGSHRGVPDISMSGACSGGVDIYQSFAGQPAGWYPTCGTSEATPLFAGVVALADQVAHHGLGVINPALYRLSALRAPGIVDVTRGSNTVSFSQGGKLQTVHGFAARAGYDLASGIGTVDAARFVFELASLAGH
ncbi:MAG TPA: S53 family peptidase [Streptosporangiaceae bacterium]|nr:S53 family peptidase [Streptosporangiaceae bacterium]